MIVTENKSIVGTKQPTDLETRGRNKKDKSNKIKKDIFEHGDDINWACIKEESGGGGAGGEERARDKEWKIKRKMKGRLREDKSSKVKMTKRKR